MYLFNTELWLGGLDEGLRYGTRDSVNRRVVDPPRYFQPLIVDHRMRSDLGASRMDESASGADLHW